MIRAAAAVMLLIAIAAPGRAEPIGAPVAIDTLVAGAAEVTVTVDDPVYKKTKHYAGYRLADLLRRAYPDVDGWAAAGAELVLTSTDGYTPSMDLARALRHQGVVATRDLDRPAADPWEPFPKGRKMATPAPYYLVWAGVRASEPGFAWPYKLARFSVQSFEFRYGQATPPAGAPAQAQRGFRLFVQNCVSCHSVNQVGGDIGPELNVPRNVTEYWSPTHLAAFVAAPESYRLRSRMPNFSHLPQADRSAILAYLAAMRGRKLCGGQPC